MKRIILALVTIFALNINAATLKNQSEIDNLIKKIMENLGKDEVNKSLDLMKPYVIIPDAELEAVRGQFKNQAPMLKNRFGNVIGAEFLTKKEVGKSLIQIKIIQKYERHLMGWKFIFYKNDKGWVLNSFRTTDQIDSMFR